MLWWETNWKDSLGSNSIIGSSVVHEFKNQAAERTQVLDKNINFIAHGLLKDLSISDNRKVNWQYDFKKTKRKEKG